MKCKRLLAVLGWVLTIALLAGVMAPMAVANQPFTFLNPFGFDESNMPVNQPLANRLADVGDGNILIVNFGRPNDAHVTGEIANNLIGAHESLTGATTVNIPINTAGARPASDFDNWANNAAVVIGVVDDNMAALWTSYYAREIEARGTPVVVIVNELFNQALINGALKNGFTQMRTVVIDSLLYSRSYGRPVGAERNAWINANILNAGVLADAYSALTAPLTADETTPPVITPEMMGVFSSVSQLAVHAPSIARAQREFFNLSITQGFGDGLPLIIPTTDLVNEMIAEAGGRSGSEILGMMVGGGIVTIENVAVNSVMAGAAPEYFPIILAAMEAIATSREDAGFNIDRAMRQSTGDTTITLIVSGPLSHELGMINDRSVEDNILGGGPLGNTLSPNVSIGRAVALAYRNIGLNRPEDTARRGAMIGLQEWNIPVIAETLRSLPDGWVSHSEFMGFGADTNTVSVLITSQDRLVTGSGAGVGTGTQDPLPAAVATQAGQGRAGGVVSFVALAGPGADVISRPMGTDPTSPDFTAGNLGSAVRNMTNKAMLQQHIAGSAAAANLVWPIVVGGCAAPNMVISSGNLSFGSGFQAQAVGSTRVSSAPLGFAVNTEVAGQAVLTWTAPARMVGNAAFEVSADGGQNWSFAGSDMTYTFTNLSEGTHVFAVRAVNASANNAAEVANVDGIFQVLFETRSGRGAWAIVRSDVEFAETETYEAELLEEELYEYEEYEAYKYEEYEYESTEEEEDIA